MSAVAVSSKEGIVHAARESLALVPYRGNPEAILRESLAWTPARRGVLDRCYFLIQTNNRLKPAATPAVVILQGSSDVGGALVTYELAYRIEELVKNHYVVLQILEQNEQLGDAVRRAAKELGDRAIVALIVRAHGDAEDIQLGKHSFYKPTDVKKEDFACLDPKGSIILDMCEGGKSVAEKIAAVQSRAVFATPEMLYTRFFTPCCAEHGLGMVSFGASDSESINMIVKKYQLQGSRITATAPCSATAAEIDKIKRVLFEQTMQAAEQGDADAQIQLSNAYFSGKGIRKSLQEAGRWAMKAARLGHVGAQGILGLLYERGEGAERSLAQAVHWYWKAAEQGNVFAQNQLLRLYKNSRIDFCYYKRLNPEFGVYKEVVGTALLHAMVGDAHCQYVLGLCYEQGVGPLPQSDEQAAKWYKRAAEQGYLLAEDRLIILQLKGLKL